MRRGTQPWGAIDDNDGVKDQLQRAKQALEAEPAVAGDAGAAADKDGGGGGGAGAVAGKSQARAKKADDHHARHAAWVHWQANNLLADGLVGPKTLEAAKLVAKQAGGAKGAESAKNTGGAKDAAGGADAGKEHGAADGEEHAAADGKDAAPAAAPGAAEGAEAAADKPKLDDSDVDEQVTPAVGGAVPAPLAAKKEATLADFELLATQLEAALSQFKQPQGQGPQKPITQDYVEGTEDKEAPPALGAMMKTEVLQGYQEAAKNLETSWASLGQPQARARFLLDAVNRAIAVENVPAIKNVLLVELTNPGQFNASSWVMEMNKPIFEATVPENLGQVASQVFHEGRHAEQRFAVARLVAGKTTSIGQIQKQAAVSQDIAKKALELRSEPMSPEQEKAAEGFKRDTVDNPAHHAIENAAGQITDAANQAAAAFRTMSPDDQAIVSARWQELRQRAITALDAYYHLSTERDAYAAQKQLAAATR